MSTYQKRARAREREREREGLGLVTAEKSQLYISEISVLEENRLLWS
jgi:hypothetical protein